MTEVKISYVKWLQNERKKINSLPLNQIIWTDDEGNFIEYPQKLLEEFRFTGLNNIDFITIFTGAANE